MRRSRRKDEGSLVEDGPPDAVAIAEACEEAQADLDDALELARTPGGGPMALWHAGQAAEKFLRVLAMSAGRRTGILWDVLKVFESVKDLSAAANLAGAVETIASASKEGASAGTLRAQTLVQVIEAARTVRRAVLQGLGRDVPPDEPLDVVRVSSEEGPRERRTQPAPVDARTGHGSDGPPAREGRSEAERQTSYVRVFLLCERCGVRIPRTQQTARGRVPCPLCGRTMVKAS